MMSLLCKIKMNFLQIWKHQFMGNKSHSHYKQKRRFRNWFVGEEPKPFGCWINTWKITELQQMREVFSLTVWSFCVCAIWHNVAGTTGTNSHSLSQYVPKCGIILFGCECDMKSLSRFLKNLISISARCDISILLFRCFLRDWILIQFGPSSVSPH